MKKKILIFSFIFFIIDIASKVLLNHFLVLGKAYKIMDKFLYITLAYNDGISFSMLKGQKYLIILISLIIMVFLYIYMKKFKENKRNIIAFSLIYGGLFGNLINRLVTGYVIDFIDVYIFNYNYPIFNLADSFIFIGICLLLYAIFKGEDNENNSK